MQLDVTGRQYRNSLEEANRVDKMVLRQLLGARIKMVRQVSARASSEDTKGLAWFRAEHHC